MLNPHVISFVTDWIAVCSIVHTLLPPWETLDDFPRAQRYYKIVVYTIGYMALNGRSTVYKSISTQNPDGINAPASKDKQA